MHRFVLVLVSSIGFASVAFPRITLADGCGVSHEECTYTCTEYYPNGTDCRKTKKECHKVCDDFSVKKSGDTTEHQHLNRDTSGDDKKDSK